MNNWVILLNTGSQLSAPAAWDCRLGWTQTAGGGAGGRGQGPWAAAAWPRGQRAAATGGPAGAGACEHVPVTVHRAWKCSDRDSGWPARPAGNWIRRRKPSEAGRPDRRAGRAQRLVSPEFKPGGAAPSPGPRGRTVGPGRARRAAGPVPASRCQPTVTALAAPPPGRHRAGPCQ